MDISNEIFLGAAALKRGELVAFPTETVYGLGADATNDAAVAKVYAAKGRPSFNPLISHVHDVEAARALGEFSRDARKLADQFWPGPLTLVVPRSANCKVSLLASAGLPSIALRVPGHALALQLLAAFGGPVVAPSANPSGRISPTTAGHVRTGLENKVSAVIDGGPSAIGVESTVVSFMDGDAKLLRPGGLARGGIEKILGHGLRVEDDALQPHSPGQLESHYAPRARLLLNVKAPGPDETYLGFGSYESGPHSLSRRGDVVEAAANLFRLLHELDDLGAMTIAVAPIPMNGLGEAINDRLRRAAAPRPHHAT
jgi:L-threonylcarbamoyladenylate synthase